MPVFDEELVRRVERNKIMKKQQTAGSKDSPHWVEVQEHLKKALTSLSRHLIEEQQGGFTTAQLVGNISILSFKLLEAAGEEDK